MAIKLRGEIANLGMMSRPVLAIVAAGLIASCAAKLPPPSRTTSTPSLLPPLSGTNTNIIAGKPRAIYERIARQGAKCWFGPFGSVHNQYMTHADVPPPSSTAPVTMAVHRRLQSRKKPWGPALLRVQFSGTSTTTLNYKNVGLPRTTFDRMTQEFTRWAHGGKDCPELHDTDPKWAPQAVSTRNDSTTARRR